MSARGMLSVVGTAVGGLIGWNGEPGPSADPAAVRELFAELGLPVGTAPEDLDTAVRRFQNRVGLEPDGVAGPHTIHLLARYAKEARELRRFEHAAAA
ncbi:peptidoglycan-binding protein [Actinoplanes sp. NPDC049316]|uniref:peptidoglycan-binding protein n=1 Tax=Actinoplanes sp. NPDC049316 TaxID=3154727 RepID=UPI00341212CA